VVTSRVDLSIVIPAYREAHRLGSSLDTLARFLEPGRLGTVEVVVVVASRDDTATAARSRAASIEHLRVIEIPNMGKGGAVRLGLLDAVGRHRLFMDADLATPLRHVEAARASLEQGADVVIGVRDLRSAHRGPRRFVSTSGNAMARLLAVPGVRDTQCGFKAFTAEAAGAILSRQRVTGWAFDIELLAIARRLDYRIDAIPVPDWTDVAGGTIPTRALAGSAVTAFGGLLGITANRALGRYR